MEQNNYIKIIDHWRDDCTDEWLTGINYIPKEEVNPYYNIFQHLKVCLNHHYYRGCIATSADNYLRINIGEHATRQYLNYLIRIQFKTSDILNGNPQCIVYLNFCVYDINDNGEYEYTSIPHHTECPPELLPLIQLATIPHFNKEFKDYDYVNVCFNLD